MSFGAGIGLLLGVVERHDGPKGVGEGYLFLSGFWSVVFMISSHYF